LEGKWEIAMEFIESHIIERATTVMVAALLEEGNRKVKQVEAVLKQISSPISLSSKL
jgi:hypothetical protein